MKDVTWKNMGRDCFAFSKVSVPYGCELGFFLCKLGYKCIYFTLTSEVSKTLF